MDSTSQDHQREQQSARSALLKDKTLQSLLAKMPMDVQNSFTEKQLSHIRLALGARTWGSHKVDLRSTFKFFRYRYYYVFVAGRNRRELSRKEKRAGMLIQSALITGFVLFSASFGILVLYLAKSALGIDLIPGFSFGVWDWFKSLFNG